VQTLRGDLAPFESIGLPLAALLLLALRLLLPRGARGLLVQPLALLALHLGALAAQRAFDPATATARVLSGAATVLLLGSLGRSAVLLVLDVAAVRRLRRPPPRIVRDLTQALVYAAILLAAMRAAGVDPGSILTTSALLTAVVALSLQETLGNLVAGLAIQVQRPFDVDDWIQFDGDPKHIGRVIEINWRATKVITLDEVEVIVPNATLAKAPITNFTKPTRTSRRSLYVYLPSHVPPHVVERTILESLAGCFGVLAEPAASVVTNGFVEGNVEYWIRFFTDQFDKRDGVDGAARNRVYYALGRLGLSPAAAPNRAVQMQEATSAARIRSEAAVAERRQALQAVDFLRALPEEQEELLAARSARRMYAVGEVVVRQGDASTEMFVIQSGEVAVRLERGASGTGEVELARLGPGEFFGEMSLMTGESRNATVRARTACELLVIDHGAFRAVLQSAPEIAGRVSRVIAERQAALAGQRAVGAPEEPTVQERSSVLLDRIRRFFAL
jgi:small-conductance mechanosensitive channel/CRP-like cAMP-binding protein